jgi:hypothetical protein
MLSSAAGAALKLEASKIAAIDVRATESAIRNGEAPKELSSRFFISLSVDIDVLGVLVRRCTVLKLRHILAV